MAAVWRFVRPLTTSESRHGGEGVRSMPSHVCKSNTKRARVRGSWRGCGEPNLRPLFSTGVTLGWVGGMNVSELFGSTFRSSPSHQFRCISFLRLFEELPLYSIAFTSQLIFITMLSKAFIFAALVACANAKDGTSSHPKATPLVVPTNHISSNSPPCIVSSLALRSGVETRRVWNSVIRSFRVMSVSGSAP